MAKSTRRDEAEGTLDKLAGRLLEALSKTDWELVGPREGQGGARSRKRTILARPAQEQGTPLAREHSRSRQARCAGIVGGPGT